MRYDQICLPSVPDTLSDAAFAHQQPIDGLKAMSNVHFEKPPLLKPSQKSLGLLNRSMIALSNLTSKGMGQVGAFKMGCQAFAQGMMDYPISKVCGLNASGLRIFQHKLGIGLWTISLIL